mgnify:FL=1
MAKKRYGSRGKRFIGPTKGGKMIWQGKGRKGKRGKFFSRGVGGRVSGVSGKDAASAARRGVPVSLKIPINANLPSTRVRLRPRTSLYGPSSRSIKIVGSGRGRGINRLKITHKVPSVAKSFLPKIAKGIPIIGTAMALLTPNKTATSSQEKKHMKGIGWEKEFAPRKKVKKADPKRISTLKPSPKIAKPPVIAQKVINQPKAQPQTIAAQKPTKVKPKVKSLSAFEKAFKAARFGKEGYEGKTFSFNKKKYLAVTKDDLKRFKVKTLGQYKVKKLAMKITKREISLDKLRAKGATMQRIPRSPSAKVLDPARKRYGIS